ncbi:MAG: tripartite tricarboxylate transporter substrate binding protein [Chelatococcus sp.]|jgi:tripartite-type tricarboxylate transporter receptor subunit TctC|uniref:Bug family tripartite tricarboxylate transporter substrate binding protein n=1 Tax=Chelatococcus sp. TaxID=1953771 RepID=UPI0025C55B0D|nr:tripartite tricarboxylate transporter substrate binding protein [Chelatococcus sp.]MBX3539127.1 tripartite tricarboxylate transporter substrate binding protein [Chelatococcus sp.]
MKLTASVIVVAFLGSTAAPLAQDKFPAKPITVVIPAGPGSSTDTNARLVLNKIEKQGSLGQPAVVVNQTSAPIAATRVKDARPDGHELLVYHLGLMGTQAVGKIGFGAEAFKPIAQTGSTAFLIVAAEKGPYPDLKSLVEAAKAAPSKITEANSIGGASHIATLALAQSAGYTPRVVHVGDGPSRLQSVLGGHSAYTVVSPPEYKGFAGTGIKALAVLGSQRSPDWPDVPSTAELGYPVDVSVDVWWLAPSDTPPAVVETLASAVEKAMGDAELQEAFKKQGINPVFLRGAPLADKLSNITALVKPMGAALGGQ